MYPGFCDSCCSCPSPQFAYIQRAASKSKCGFLNPSDGKYYFNWNSVTSYTGNCTTDPAYPPGYTSTASWSEVTTTTRTSTCAGITTTCSFVGSSSQHTDSGASPPFAGSVLIWEASSNLTGTSTGTSCSSSVGTSSGTVTFPHFDGTPDEVYSLGYRTEYDGDISLSCIRTGPTTVDTFTSEYSTSTLESDTVSALPAWGTMPGFGGGYPSHLASAELSSTEATYSILQSKYQFAHPVPPNATYKLTWVERFTPDTGSPTDTPKSYTWDGTVPSGYASSNSSTWPKTTIFEVDQPSSNGSVSIHNLAVDCGGGPSTLFS